MKKLMTMIAAVAMSFGLYADATLNPAFEAKDLTAGPYEATAPGWTYSGGADTLNITGEEGERVLEIATGTAELTRNAAADGGTAAAWPIGEDGLFIQTTIDFKTQALDTLPTLGATDKLAIFALDTTALEEDAVPELEKGTNLFVIAGYGDQGGKALYRVDTLDEIYLAEGTPHYITVKAYTNVLATAEYARSGFLVSITDDTTVSPLSVVSAYVIGDDGKVDWTTDVSSAYLGGVATAAKLTKRVNEKKLFLSADVDPENNGKLASIGFKGNAKIASVGFTETDPGFGDDAQVMSIAQDSVAITNVTDAIAFDKDNGVITGIDGQTITIYPEFTKDIVKVTVNGTLVPGGDVKAESYSITFADGGTIKAEEWDTAATVGNKKFPYIFGDDPNTCAIAWVNENGGTLVLAKDVTALEEGDAFKFNGTDVVLDLAGKTLTVLDGQALNNSGKLTIIDSATGGTIVGATENYSTLIISNGVFSGTVTAMAAPTTTATITIAGGTFDGKVSSSGLGGTETITAVGGKFLQQDDQDPTVDVNTKKAVEEFIDKAGYEVVDDENGYWVVQEKKNYVAEIDGKGYETLAEAFAAAEDTDTVKLLVDIELDDTLVIDKVFTFDLNTKEISLPAAATVGIDVKAATTIRNGSIKSALAANVTGSKAINIPNKNVSLRDVAIDAAHYEYAIYANCDDDCKDAGDKLDWFYTDTTGRFAALACDSVTITGNGSLFHVEGMTATLNNCSATRDANALFGAAHHQAAVYSSCNSTTTITGTGTYTHVNALQSGNLGGKIVVNGGSFTGNIKSYMKLGAHSELESLDDYKAVFTFNAGSYTGNIVFEDADSRTLDSFTKEAAVTIAAPTGYVWDNNTTLVKITAVTPVITLSSTEEEYVEGIKFPTVTVESYTEGTDYTKAWNEQTITEPDAGATNTYTVTVTMIGKYTGSNTATFKVYKKAAPDPVIDPTNPSDPMDETAAKNAADEINKNPTKYIKAPAEFNLTGEALTAYQGYFTATVAPSTEADKFVVQLELNSDGTNKVVAAEKTTDAAVLTTVLAATEATSMTVPAEAVIPGFYYSLKQGAAVTALGFAKDTDANKKGGVDTLTFQLQKPPTSGFYQMIVTPVPVAK